MLPRERIIIIGAGPAGCAAAVQCKRLGITPLLLDRTGEAGGLIENAFYMENYPGLEGPITGPDFVGRLRADLAGFDLEVTRGTVKRVEPGPDGIRVQTVQGTMATDAVIVAVGTIPRPVGLDGEGELAGGRLFYEVKDLLPFSPASVVVAGGGEAAFDYALSLSRAGARVHLSVKSARPSAGERLEQQVADTPGIKVATRSLVVACRPGGPGVIATVEDKKGRRDLEADALLVAVGRRSTAWELVGPQNGTEDGRARARARARAGARSREGTQEMGLTYKPGLFIAGDARLGTLGQVGIAVGDGLLAAMRAVKFAEERG